ncbi:MAG: RHS repeat domain-containing protein [Pseudomonadota bacterium]
MKKNPLGTRMTSWPGKYILVMLMLFTMPAAAAAESLQFSYDPAGRLIEANYQIDQRVSYTYDPAGNLSIRTQGTVTSAPIMNLTITGITVSLAWQPVAGATGYKLVYAPYPYTGPATINTIDLGGGTDLTVDLWSGAAFYVALRAYNAVGSGAYSNIEYFIMP